MDKEKLKAYGVDYENAVKRFAGNEALYERFLKKLTEDDHLAIGEQAMKEERYEDVLEAVHALKEDYTRMIELVRRGIGEDVL